MGKQNYIYSSHPMIQSHQSTQGGFQHGTLQDQHKFIHNRTLYITVFSNWPVYMYNRMDNDTAS